IKFSPTVEIMERIVGWRELDHYLENVFVERWNVGEPVETLVDIQLSAKETIAARLQIESGRKKIFRSFGPQATWSQLMRLAPIIGLAAERVKFEPGDRQRDWISREFADEMVFAWCSAT